MHLTEGAAVTVGTPRSRTSQDHDGFDALYAEEWAPMVRVAALLVGVEVAEEVVQDAFVQVHQRWGSLANPGGYLRRCVVNRCLDHHRRQARLLRRLPELEAAARREAAGPEPDDDELLAALDRLPARQRAALVLRFYVGCTDGEIAEALGARPSTVRSLVHRGLATLRQEVER